MSCTFCDIIAHKKPAKIFFEDDRVIVFADIFPRAEVHLLICPKSHYSTILNAPDEQVLPLIETSRYIARKLGIEDNFRLVLNNGAKAGQIIEHLHFHFLSNASGVKVEFKN
jgi:histidine triad (HIT) family protein